MGAHPTRETLLNPKAEWLWRLYPSMYSMQYGKRMKDAEGMIMPLRLL